MILPTDRFTYRIVGNEIIAYSLDDMRYKCELTNSRNCDPNKVKDFYKRLLQHLNNPNVRFIDTDIKFL